MNEKHAQTEILPRQRIPRAQIAHLTMYNELKRGTVAQKNVHLRLYTKYFGDAGQRVYEEYRKNSCPPLKLVS